MAGKNTAAFGIHKDRVTAETAVDRLLAEGFSNQDVSVLMSDNSGSKDFATEKNTKAPEGTTTGVGVGGAVGEPLDCWLASAPWLSQELARSSQPAQSWRVWPAWALAVQSAAW